ncbi:MAG: hypothetical protein K2P84_02275 [Undibacterium sp.]|nr:hypothetical protein [Undibacterium sp.]
MQATAPTSTVEFSSIFCWSTIFSKTSKGREEITQRRVGLNARQRGVLIMLNGIKRLDHLISPIPKEELGSIVHFLAEQELIEISPNSIMLEEPSMGNTIKSANESIIATSTVTQASVLLRSSTLSATENTQTRAQAAFLTDTKKLREVKDFMTTTAQTYLGLLSADLIRRIEKSKDAPQLMAIVGQWYIALRESKNGQRFASTYMEQALAVLRGDDAMLDPSVLHSEN